MRPKSGRDGRDTVTDAGAVLPDDHPMTTTCPGEPVGHVRGTLLMDHRDQADASRGEDIHRVHEG